MIKYLYIAFFVASATALWGQGNTAWESGAVSFTSSRNVYVKFSTTKDIKIGDTLFISTEGRYLPALLIDNKSSTSTVCTPIADRTFQKKDLLFARVPKPKSEPMPEEAPTKAVPEETAEVKTGAAPVLTPEEDQDDQPVSNEKIRARLSAASYSSLSDYRDLHRMRYALSFQGAHLNDSRFSTDAYVTFRHEIGAWDEVRDNLSNALKVYALSVRYDIDSMSNLTLGRRINPNMSSIGAIDGVQYERSFGRVQLGGIAGFRPDFTNYGFNPDLLEAGGYVMLVSDEAATHHHQTTFGFMEQTNRGNTDRRFAYLQHSSNPFDALNLFGSFEVDLYENLNSEAHGTLKLTNLFLSMRYRVNRKLRLSLSYDNRRNIIYYESYRSFIDQLVQDETRQGLRFNLNLRPIKLITLGLNTGWRFQKSGNNESKNLRLFLNCSRIPKLNMRASLSANFLQTSFIESQIFDLRLSRQIIKKRLDGDVYGRIVEYHYRHNDSIVRQNIVGVSFSLRIRKQLSLFLYYEGTFDHRDEQFHRINTKIIQRF